MDWQNQWNERGATYAKAINDMLAFADVHGWEAWQGPDAQDDRQDFAPQVLERLREANLHGTTSALREQLPPSFAPFAQLAHERGQYVGQLVALDNDRLVFMVGAPYEPRQAYLLQDGMCQPLSREWLAVGKAKRGTVIAVADPLAITLRDGWNGPILNTLPYATDPAAGITHLFPFNAGDAALVVSAAGIDLLTPQTAVRLLPVADGDGDEGLTGLIDMENADLSHDNRLICAGSQSSDHLLFGADGTRLGRIGPQSEYPHFCLFSTNDSLLLSNSCHFYNGVSIAVNVTDPASVNIAPYQEPGSDPGVRLIDPAMRVYGGVSFSGGVILGDAHGYLRAYDWQGQALWRHYLGGTISGMALSPDEQRLWVGTYAGTLHQLALGQGQDAHTIGNGDHKEEHRWLFWKGESSVLKW
ncbi:hypothetical protein [Deinococcus aquaedulcis]|uniref:hypothetical protein n=1 Tax=Deinococcus aquaedulcis TaxID=2840455 RepID=UPI001C8352BC|nr:hypothetical protein [Deinococcus aquaedulcis]